MGKRILLFIVPVLFILVSPKTRAEVITVGPNGDYAKIQEAVVAASDGDTILVAPGQRDSFKINNKSLYVIADAGGMVKIEPGVVVKNLARDKTVVLKGLKDNISSFSSMEIILENNSGAIRLENCYVSGRVGDNETGSPTFHPDGYPGVTAINCSDVALVRCTIEGGRGDGVWDWHWQGNPGNGAPGIKASHSQVALYDCEVIGGNGGFVSDVCSDSGGTGGSGCKTVGSFLFASGCTFIGGKGGDGGESGMGPGGGGGRGGHGIHLAPTVSSTAHFLDIISQGGPGGIGEWGYAPSGERILEEMGQVNHIPLTAHHFEMPSPLREGETCDMTFTGENGALAFLLVSPATVGCFERELHGQLLVPTGPKLKLFFMGVIPQDGPLVLPWQVPDLPPYMEVKNFQVQSLFFLDDASYLLGPGQALQILDAALL